MHGSAYEKLSFSDHKSRTTGLSTYYNYCVMCYNRFFLYIVNVKDIYAECNFTNNRCKAYLMPNYLLLMFASFYLRVHARYLGSKNLNSVIDLTGLSPQVHSCQSVGVSGAVE